MRDPKFVQFCGHHIRMVSKGAGAGVAGSYWAQLRRPEVWKPLLLVIVIFFLQQFSGMSVITYYAVNAIKDAGSSVDAVGNSYRACT